MDLNNIPIKVQPAKDWLLEHRYHEKICDHEGSELMVYCVLCNEICVIDKILLYNVNTILGGTDDK